MSDKVVRVSDLRHSDFNVSLPGAKVNSSGGHAMSIENWQLTVQVRILRELEKLNALLTYPNLIGIPETLREIKRCVGRIPTIARPRKPKVKK